VGVFAGGAIYGPVLNTPDYLSNAYPSRIRVIIGMLIEVLLNDVPVVGIGVMLFPIFKNIKIQYTVQENSLRGGSKMHDVYEDIADYVRSLEIIDTHEHLPPFEHLREQDTDVLREYLSHYLSADLISAGLSKKDYEKVINEKLPIMEKWKLIEPYWDYVRHTGYARALDISVKALYGIERICADTLEELDRSFQKTLKEAHYEKVLKKESKITLSLLHDIPRVDGKVAYTSNLECDRKFFRNVLPIDRFIYPQQTEDITRIEEEAHIPIRCFEDYLDAGEILFENALNHGAVALKSALAYQRSLYYERATKNEAEEEFNEFFKFKHMGTYLPAAFDPGKKFQDYMMHFLLRLASRKKLTIQFHTGIQEGSGNILSQSDPSLLSNLFLEYPDVDFDIFHIGYPYHNIVGVLAKNFTNVFIDMCWAHIICPETCVSTLVNWIDTVPLNKINAFGGDYLFIDGVYGHQYLARENVSRALAIKVGQDIFDAGRAKEIARMFFYTNPCMLFKLQDSTES
jgi:hypothetical protein